ncbi:MAG: acetate--CoA ligase family protein [Acidimicrobiales bacterium]|nr:acetate--CoA ligase family protein [Acidimicrobiales bacterium]
MTTKPTIDVTRRPLALREVDLDLFFRPRTVAVIGASDSERKPNTAMWRKINAWGQKHGATVIPVHPERETVDGVPCYRSILDIPGDIDLAVILVGDAVGMFETVLEKEPRFAVIFSAGFAETGEEGARLQRRLEELIASGSTHLLGPNTNLNAFETFRDDLDGPAIALITQSGHQGRPVFQAQEFGVRLSHWAPTGNEADLEFADFARYFADHPEVGVIAAYIEGFKDGRTLMLAADHAAKRRKPIVCVKVGRTAEGESMARSHTGHLTGSDKVIDAVFRTFGITRVDGLDELTDVAAMFARTKPPRRLRQTGRSGRGRGNTPKAVEAIADRPLGVCIYAISGGTGAHMADLVAAAGLHLPELTPKTQRALHQWIPSYLRVSNPVDNGGPPSTDERGRKILDAIIADPNVDVIICPITGALETISRPLATDLVAAAATTDKPIFVVWGSPDTTDPVYTDILLRSSLPVFRTFNNCVKAARAYADYWAFQAHYRSPFDSVATKRSTAARKVAPLLVDAASEIRSGSGSPALSEHTSKEILRAYGIRTSQDLLVSSATEAAKAAATIGYPVVMKIASPDLPHKSDLGLVAVGLSSAAEVKRTYNELIDRAERASHGRARIEGVLVCEQVDGGIETVVGVSRDPLFGPVVMFGLGGVFVEVFEDVTFRVPPFERDEAERMVREVKGFKLLEGVRGHKPADVRALVDTIMKVQRLATDNISSIGEVDINPLVVLPRGRGVVALDALVILSSRYSTPSSVSPPIR